MVQNNCTVELQRDAYVKDLGVVFDEFCCDPRLIQIVSGFSSNLSVKIKEL